MVVGGLAVKSYCPERKVGDLDVLVDATAENTPKTVSAFWRLIDERLFAPREIEQVLRFSGYGKCLRLRAHLRADVFLAKQGFDFPSAYARSVERMVNDVPVRVTSRRDLIKYKETDTDPNLRLRNQRDLKLLRQ